MTDILASALELAAQGYPVFPVRLCPDACLKCDICKTPACSHGFKDASRDPEQIRELWRRYPGGLIGVPTGEISGFDALDIDSVKRPKAIVWWFAHRRYIPQTRTHQTGSGGLHLLFKHHHQARTGNGRLGTGIDVKANGGYIVWWPAFGRRVYRDLPIIDWPNWLIARQQPIRSWGLRYREDAVTSNANIDALASFVASLSEGNRNSGTFWAFCRAFEAVAEGLVGEHVAINQIAVAAAGTGLTQNEIRATARSAKRAPGRKR